MAAEVRCPPDRQVLVDYLRLQEALTQEVLRSGGDEVVLSEFQQLLLLLEHLSHLEYVNDLRYVKTACLAVKPYVTEAEAAILASSGSSSIAAAAEEQLLAMIIQLLLRTRYFPLTQDEWSLAQNYQFTFDIPVRINWGVLDDGLLGRFWSRQAALHDALTTSTTSSSDDGNGLAAAMAVATAAAQCLSSSSSPILKSVLLYPELLNRSALPAFVDRMLVFHRGVGVATSDGLFLNKKLDLLMSYLLVEPAVRLLRGIRQQLDALPAPAAGSSTSSITQQQQQQQRSAGGSSSGDDMVLNSFDGGAGLSLLSSDSIGESISGAGVVRPFASADLHHQWATTVERRSLRSLMPGPRQVLHHFWDKLVLQEPTFRDVVVIYRANSAAAAGGGDTHPQSIHAAESAVTAALYAGSGAAAMAADAVIDAAQAVAEAKSAMLSGGRGRKKERPGEQQQGGPAQAAAGNEQQRETAAAATASLSKQPAAPGDAHCGPPKVPERFVVARPPGGSSRRRALLLNPSNVCIRSFCDVAMADLELVFPSKQAEVTATTLVRSALTAVGALGAAAACLQQASLLHWSLPVLLPAAGVVAGRAIKVLSTIKAQQAALNSTMMQMQYQSSCDSQEGVLVKLVDELREQHLKEVATAYAVMLAAQQRQQQQQQHTQDNAGPAAAAAAASVCGTRVFDVLEIDAACEQFLLTNFGLKIDFVVEEALPRMLAWGLVSQVGPRSYSLTPLQPALERLRGRWSDMLHTRHAAAAVAAAARQAAAGSSASTTTTSGGSGGDGAGGGDGASEAPANGAAARVQPAPVAASAVSAVHWQRRRLLCRPGAGSRQLRSPAAARPDTGRAGRRAPLCRAAAAIAAAAPRVGRQQHLRRGPKPVYNSQVILC